MRTIVGAIESQGRWFSSADLFRLGSNDHEVSNAFFPVMVVVKRVCPCDGGISFAVVMNILKIYFLRLGIRVVFTPTAAEC